MREFFSFSAWLTAGQIVNTLNWRFDYLLVGKLLGGSALGFYSMGSNLAMLATREATTPLTQTIYPAFAGIRDDAMRLAAAYQRAQAMLSAVALPAGIGVAVIAEPLVRLALGEKWAPVIPIIQALAAVYAVQTLGSLVQPLGMAKGETRLLFMRDTQMLFVRIPVIVAGLLFFGLPGVIFGRVFTGLFGAFVNMMLVKRFTGVTLRDQLFANTRSLISVGIMAAAVAFVSNRLGVSPEPITTAMQIMLLAALGGLLYCGSTLLLWLAMGRPQGPETEVAKIVAKIWSKLRPA
jgi:O-antigen/teichoic acid export membrane protein